MAVKLGQGRKTRTGQEGVRLREGRKALGCGQEDGTGQKNLGQGRKSGTGQEDWEGVGMLRQGRMAETWQEEGDRAGRLRQDSKALRQGK
jgi:hypothetical protein